MKPNPTPFNDLASLATTAMGAARVLGEEAKTAAQARGRDMVAGLDLADKDSLEVIREIAISALDRVEALEARVASLEAKSQMEAK